MMSSDMTAKCMKSIDGETKQKTIFTNKLIANWINFSYIFSIPFILYYLYSALRQTNNK